MPMTSNEASSTIWCILLTYSTLVSSYILSFCCGKTIVIGNGNDGWEWLETFPACFKQTLHLHNKSAWFLDWYWDHIIILYTCCSRWIPTSTSQMPPNTPTIPFTSILPITFVRCLGLSTIIFGSQFFFGSIFLPWLIRQLLQVVGPTYVPIREYT